MTHSMLGMFGLGGGEVLLILTALLVSGGLLVVGVGLALALAMWLTNKHAGTAVVPQASQATPADHAEPVEEPASLAGTRFHSVNLTGAEFENVNLSNARFHNVNLSNAVISAAQLGGAAFKHVGPPPDDEGARPRQRPVRFEEMMLCDSTFRKVDLTSVRVTDCDLSGMTIDGILVSDLLAAYRRLNSAAAETSPGTPSG